MKLFSNNIVPYASAEGDKIYPIVVDIKKGIKSGEAISFVTADNQVGVITVDFMDGNSSYSIEDCMVTSTIRRPDGTVLEIPCDIISQSTIEIPLGINGTYQEGVHTFDLKIVRGNGKVIGVPTMSYSVSGSLSSDDVVEGDDRLPVLTMVLDNAQDKLTRLDKAIAGATNDLEVKEARDGEVTLNARLERDLEKGKIHFVDVEGSNISTESEEGYLENVEILGNTWQDANNLSDIRSVGTKVEGQELYEIPVLSYGKNLLSSDLLEGEYINNYRIGANGSPYSVNDFKMLQTFKEIPKNWVGKELILGFVGCVAFYSNNSDSSLVSRGFQGSSFTIPQNAKYFRLDYQIYAEGKLQLEEGTVATPYEPYQEDKLTILSPTPLEKVGDVADRIVCKDGVYGVEKNVNSGFIPSSANWLLQRNNGTINRFVCLTSNMPFTDFIRTTNNVITNKFIATANVSDYTIGCMFGNNDGFIVHANIQDIPTLVDFKNFIGDGVHVKYPTTQPIFIPLPHDQQVKLRTFANRTNISFLTEIEPTLKSQVPKSLGATVNTHTTQIDNLNKELDRVKKLEESTVSTVITDKAFTTIVETTQGYFEDVKLEGKTLVNLAKQPTNNGRINTMYATISSTVHKLTPSTEYTYIISNNGEELVDLYLNNHNCFPWTRIKVSPKDIIIGKATTLNEIKGDIWISLGVSQTVEQNLAVILLEGDHTDKDISFFEGLKSVGQDSDEISVLSSTFEQYKLEQGAIDYQGNIASSSLALVTDFIPVHQNTIYKITDNLGIGYDRVAFYDRNKNFLYRTDSYYGSKVSEIKTIANSCFMKVSIYRHTPLTVENLPYIGVSTRQDKKQILYYNPTTQTWEKPVLREWDSIEKHSDGKYYYHKRSGEIVLNGSEDGIWCMDTYSFQSETTTLYGIPLPNFDGRVNISNSISSSFTCGDVWHLDCEMFQLHEKDRIDIRILKSKLSTQNLAGFKAWLQANNVTVVYQLAQEEVYECTNLDLITYSGETNLIVNSGSIQPKITLKVLSNVSNVVKLLQEKVSVLENKFIEGLKQVLAGDMMSLAHLLYPEDFENNHEIQTLEL